MKTLNSHIQRVLVACTMIVLSATAVKADTYVDAQLNITPRPRHDLDVYVWPDRGEGGVYYPGDQIYVNVQPSRDCFLVLYNIDTRGRLNILYPTDPWQDNFVQGGDIIEFPRYYDGVDWTIDGPQGTEYIQVVASEVPFDLPQWPVYQDYDDHGGYSDPALNDFYCPGDRSAYIDVVNRGITGRYHDWCATDVSTIYVRPRPIYRPAHVYDPWPDVFFGEIYIGFPIGGRIYIDGIFIGTAPCRIPRSYGRRTIACYDGSRLIRSQVCHVYAKWDYGRYKSHYPKYHAKAGRGDWSDHWDYDRDDDRGRYRVYEKSKRSGRDWDDDDEDRDDDDGYTRQNNGIYRSDVKSNKRSSADVRVHRDNQPIEVQRGSSKRASGRGDVIGRSTKPSTADVQGKRGKSSVQVQRDSSPKSGNVIRPSQNGKRVEVGSADRSVSIERGQKAEKRSDATVRGKRGGNESVKIQRTEKSQKRSDGVISAKRSGNESVTIKRESSTQRVEKVSKKRGGQGATAGTQNSESNSEGQQLKRTKSARAKGSRGGN